MLEAGDAVLGALYETVLRVVVRSAQGDERLPPIDPPSELIPFLRLKPRNAVAQSQVRSALRAIVSNDREIADAVAREHARRAADRPAAMQAARDGDERVLAAIASAAAAQRSQGWETVVIAAAAAAESARAGRAAGEQSASKGRLRDAAGCDRRLAAAERKLAQIREKLAKREGEFDDARTRVRDLHRELDAMRAQRDALAAEIAESATAADIAQSRARDQAAALDARLGVERATRAELERDLRTLRERVAGLEAAKLPDLESPARALEALAADLRNVRDTLGQAPPKAQVEGGHDRARSVQADARDSEQRRPRLPMGMRPDTPDVLRWALEKPALLLLVDGYNVTNQARRGWSHLRGSDQRQLLLTHLGRLRRPGGADIRVVFDASEADTIVGRRSVHGVAVEFSGGTIADDRIVEIVDALDPGRPAVAVTSDRELQQRLRDRGVPSVRSEVFLEVAGAPRR